MTCTENDHRKIRLSLLNVVEASFQVLKKYIIIKENSG